MSYKTLSNQDISTARSTLNQLVDFIETDVSSSSTRKSYQVFVTGGVGPGVTSSLFQTVYDQDFSLSTANQLFDMTVGLNAVGTTVTNIQTDTDLAGKRLFPSTSIMMREKINIYRQYAQLLLGDADSSFYAPFADTTTANRIDEALIMNVKRLFVRDGIKRETFAMRFYQTGALDTRDGGVAYANLNVTSHSGSAIFTDVGAASEKQFSQTGGPVGNLVDASNTSRKVGLIFYNQGVVMLDLKKVISGSQHVSGVISAMSNASYLDAAAGQTVIGDTHHGQGARFIPEFLTSGSIDNIVDHFAGTRFSSGSNTFMTFQNNTSINSTLVFCRATADEFNYSSNPTYVDLQGRIVVIDETVTETEQTQKSFTFVTSVGLYDSTNQLLAVAKMSRPVEKNDEKDLTFRVRLDF